MSIIEAILLGLLQGLTEFLPISSSGHLKLGQLLLGMDHLEGYVTFDLVCHLGTLLAILFSFRKELKELFTSNQRGIWLLFLATLPLVPLYFLFKPIKAIYGLPQYLGFFFLLSALFLFLGERFTLKKPVHSSLKRSSCEAAFIGCMQAIAILPGVSRSGSTIAAANFLGWERTAAAKFSFLLAIPTILGGLFLESLQMLNGLSVSHELPFAVYFAGFSVSFLVGSLALRWLMNLLKKRTFKPFAWYCLCVGIFALVYINFFYPK